jgi:hypothetical protein
MFTLSKEEYFMAQKTKTKPRGHCCGAELPPWRVDISDGDYNIPSRTLVTLSKIGRSPHDKYKLKFKPPTGGNPCPGMKSMILIPVARKPQSEISFEDLVTMVDGWNQNYLKACYDIMSSKHNYKIGVGRVDNIPTMALFIQSKYTGSAGVCRTFALVLKKLDETVQPSRPRGFQGGVLHGVEN